MPGGVFKRHAGPARALRRRRACSTRRSPSWRSRAPRSAPPSTGCGRWSRSCSATSCGSRSTARQPVREVLVHVERAGAACRSSSARAVGAGARFGACHSQTRRLVPGRARPEDRRRVDARRREGPDEGRDPRRQPGALLRAQAPLRAEGRCGRGDGALPLGEARIVRAGARRHARRGDGKGVHERSQQRRRSPRTGRRRGDRPPLSAPAGRRHRRSLRRAHEPPPGRRGGPARSAAGRRRCSGPWRPPRSEDLDDAWLLATRATSRSPTARRSRTRSFPGAEAIGGIGASQARIAGGERSWDGSERRFGLMPSTGSSGSTSTACGGAARAHQERSWRSPSWARCCAST